MNSKVCRLLILIMLAFTLLSGCDKKGLQPGTGFVDVDGGKVWYHIYGEGNATPLLVIHGGPGIPSYYLTALKVLASERPVVFYDQLGAGRSPAANDTTLWNVERFVREIGHVREALGLDEIHLYGHSWGSQLAAEYMLTNPKGVKSLILAGPSLSLPRWEQDGRILLSTMDDSTQMIIKSHEDAGTTDAPEYQDAVFEFYKMYLARKQPWPGDLDSALSTMNPELYGYMLGPSEFTITGTLKDFDVTDRLGEIRVPTLISIGEYDEVRPETAKFYASRIPNSRVVVVPGAGHLTFIDNIESDAKNISGFLHEVESGK